ncbi:uncharacterized protein [Argopecten irradians]|uniref:uncharacterized protein n=1 Tax=Argopecten irradians TaxID=31199 RepID=UPI003723DD05
MGFFLSKGLNTSAGEQFTFCFIQNLEKPDRETTSMIASNDDRTNVTLVNTTDQYQIYREDGVHLIYHRPIATLQNTGKENKGLRVITEGSIPIVSFSRTAQHSGDMFTPFPDRQLGIDHVVLTYCDAVSHCILAVVGVIDGATDVTIVFPSTFKGVLLIDNKQYEAGDKLYFTLYQLETFQLLSAANFSGVIVRSSHKVGVFVGADRTRLGNWHGNDHLEEALPPLTLWGKQYVLVSKGDDVVQIVSSANETQVNITTCDRTVQYVINASIDVIELLMECAFFYVSASHPILVAHIMMSKTSFQNPSLYFPPPVMLYSKAYVVSPLPSLYSPCQVGLVAKLGDLEEIAAQFTDDNVSWVNVSSTGFAVITVILNSEKTVIVRSRNEPFGGHIYCHIRKYIAGSTRLVPYKDDIESSRVTRTSTTMSPHSLSINTSLTSVDNTSLNCSTTCCERHSPLVNLTAQELKAIVQEFKTKLTVTKTATSAWKRKFNSANDDRPSSKGIGLLAAVFLTCVFGSVVLIDVTNFIAKKTSKTKN